MTLLPALFARGAALQLLHTCAAFPQKAWVSPVLGDFVTAKPLFPLVWALFGARALFCPSFAMFVALVGSVCLVLSPFCLVVHPFGLLVPSFVLVSP